MSSNFDIDLLGYLFIWNKSSDIYLFIAILFFLKDFPCGYSENDKIQLKLMAINQILPQLVR